MAEDVMPVKYTVTAHERNDWYRLAFEQARDTIQWARHQGCKCAWELRDDLMVPNAQRYFVDGCPLHKVSDDQSDQTEQ